MGGPRAPRRGPEPPVWAAGGRLDRPDPPGRPRVVVASDAFTGSLSSLEVGAAVRVGVLEAVPGAVVDVVGVADGGEGTVAAALSAGGEAVGVEVHGPTGEPVRATLAVLRPQGRPVRVVVELADACGLLRLPHGARAPLSASSRGLGEAVRAALDLEPAEVVVGVGGSASTDGGAGMLRALGARVLDRVGEPLPEGGAALTRAAVLDLAGVDPRVAAVRLVVATDVDSPLLGPRGAAAMFAPQKGATPEEVRLLEDALAHWAVLVHEARGVDDRGTDAPGAGAAGGVGFAMVAALGAQRLAGVDVVLDLVGLDDRLRGADLVVTGEGSLDAQTLAGKAVAGVARRAAAAGVPVVAVCGRLGLTDEDLAALGVGRAFPLSDLEPDPDRSVRDAADLLRRTGAELARRCLSP